MNLKQIAAYLCFSLLLTASYYVGRGHGYTEGYDHAEKKFHDGAVNAFGNLPYTQGSLDAERRMQLEAVRVGAARIYGGDFEWLNEPTVNYPAVPPQYE